MMAVCQFFGLDCEPPEGRRYATFTLHPSPSTVVAPKMCRSVGCTEQDGERPAWPEQSTGVRKIGGFSMGQGNWEWPADLLRGGPASSVVNMMIPERCVLERCIQGREPAA